MHLPGTRCDDVQQIWTVAVEQSSRTLGIGTELSLIPGSRHRRRARRPSQDGCLNPANCVSRAKWAHESGSVWQVTQFSTSSALQILHIPMQPYQLFPVLSRPKHMNKEARWADQHPEHHHTQSQSSLHNTSLGFPGISHPPPHSSQATAWPGTKSATK